MSAESVERGEEGGGERVYHRDCSLSFSLLLLPLLIEGYPDNPINQSCDHMVSWKVDVTAEDKSYLSLM